MGKKKIVLDTNILISALGWFGKPRQVVQRALDGEVELFLSSAQIREVQKVMEYPKLNFATEEKEKFLEVLLEVATLVEPSERIYIISEDPDDNTILEAAIEANADYIVSGDEHILHLRQFRRVRIVTASEFLKEISEKHNP